MLEESGESKNYWSWRKLFYFDFCNFKQKFTREKVISSSLYISFSICFAQDYSVPAASPRQKVEQQFSMSKITIDYGRPGVKGRKILENWFLMDRFGERELTLPQKLLWTVC
jgi:hypothetical protein